MAFESFISPYPKPGEVIDGKYEVQQMLGEGGMGAVTKAKHLLRRAPVALKFLSPSVLVTPGAVDRFLREAEAASRFESPHVVQITDVCKLPNGAPYLVMEYLEGKDLAAVIEEKGTVDVPRAIHFVLQVLRALQAAHAEGIIHRDLKPSNCFVIHRDGDDDFIKLFDFGISKIQKEAGESNSGSLTQTNSALGTPLYMSPEQARSPRSVDKRTDIYSTAVILYELLTGWTPYFSEAGELTEILFKLFTAEPNPIRNVRPDLPPALCEAIHKCLARDLDTRPSSAAEMAELLSPFADDRSKFVLDRIRHPPPPRKTAPPTSGHVEGIEAFHKMSVPGTALPSIGDRKSIGEAATQISIPPSPETSAAPTGGSAAAASSMARDAAPMMNAPASAQSDLDATRNSAMTATQALAGPAPSRFPIAIVLGVVGALAAGIALYATQHRAVPVEKDPSATSSLSATGPTPTQTGALADSTGTGATTSPSASVAASASAAPSSSASQTALLHAQNHPPGSASANHADPPENSGIHQLNDIGRKR